MPLFDSFLLCFSLRFSFSDLPTFLTLCWFGDLSATLTPPVGDAVVGDVEITDCESRPTKPCGFDGQFSHFNPHGQL
jgi:hypothetical protein